MTDPGPGRGTHPAELPLGVRPCSLAAALEILGERWSLLALREIGYGVHRFARIAGYTGASRDILADRLRKLEAAGVIELRPYSEHPPRHEYHLTQAGRELFPAMLALSQWGDRWAVDRPSLTRRHSCGEPVQVDLVCHHCGQPVSRETIHVEIAGPAVRSGQGAVRERSGLEGPGAPDPEGERDRRPGQHDQPGGDDRHRQHESGDGVE